MTADPIPREAQIVSDPPPRIDPDAIRHNHRGGSMTMNYREFTIELEHRLGTRHLLVDRSAKEPADLLLPTGVHDRLLREILRAVYRTNRCYHIKAPLDAERTLAAIAPIQAQLRDAQESDIDVIRLVDELFGIAEALFGTEAATVASLGVEELSDLPAKVIELSVARAAR